MATQRQGFLQRREAGLQIELAAAERRLSEYAMRHEMVAGYLSALYQMRINTSAMNENKRNKAKGVLRSQAEQNSVWSHHKEKGEWDKRKAYRARGLLRGGAFDQVAQSYAQVACLYLATLMQARLPRELRDLIYDYIWDEDYLGLTSGYMSPAAGSSTYLWLKPHLQPRGGHSTKPIVINPGYVDPDTAREALEAYYRVSAYRKDAFLVRSPERIHSLLYDDLFNVGVVPAEHLRAMDLHLTQEQFQWDTPAKINEAMLSEAFTQLTKGILRKKDFKLRIMIIQTDIRLKQWDLLFGILVPFYHAFQAEGAQVSVSWGYTRSNWHSETISRRYSLDEIIRVWTPYLDWKKKVIEFLDGESEILNSRRKYRNKEEEDEEDEEEEDEEDEDEDEDDEEEEDEEEEEDMAYPHESDSDASDPDELDSDESDRMSLVDDN